MTSEDFEFLLMQYADGTLTGAQRDFVEERLLEDPDALVQLASYRRLSENLERATFDHPIRWDALAMRISAATADAEARRVRNRTILWRTGVIALATCLLVAAGIFMHPRHSTIPAPISNSAIIPERHFAEVTGPAVQMASEPGKAIVKVGPPPLTADAAQRFPFAQDVVTESSHISIGSPAAGDRQ